jgi:hypothetical protein
VQHIGIGIIDARECESSCNLVISFPKSRIVASMDPKYIGFRMVVSISITILNRDLRFPLGYVTTML